MARIALKIDVDTDRGTREGVPRLVDLLQRMGARATFLFSVGPDHTGRAIRRVFRRGFFGKVRRTSVVQHYGVKTLLYGTLLPGPHIGKRNGALMRDVASRGFEVGVHEGVHYAVTELLGHSGLRLEERILKKNKAGEYAVWYGVFGRAGDPSAPVITREHSE